MLKSSNLNIRINPEIKDKAETTLNSLGLTSSNAIDLFYRQIILNKGLPFEIKIPNNNMIDISSLSEEELISIVELGLNDFENSDLKSWDDNMAQINVKIDDDVKNRAEFVCSELGLSLSSAINIYLKKLGIESRIPFDISIDPFYNENNIKYFEKKLKEYKDGNLKLVSND